jgi:hypothetical protein
MNAPTPIERDHYAKLMGRTIVGIQWEELEGQALPVLLLSGTGRDRQPAHAVVLADPREMAPGISITTCKGGCVAACRGDLGIKEAR